MQLVNRDRLSHNKLCREFFGHRPHFMARAMGNAIHWTKLGSGVSLRSIGQSDKNYLIIKTNGI